MKSFGHHLFNSTNEELTSTGDKLTGLFSGPFDSASSTARFFERLAILDQHRFLSSEVSTSLALSALKERMRPTAIPELPLPMAEYFDLLEKEVLPHAINMGSPRCLGHMTSIVSDFARLLGTLVVGLNQNLVKAEASKAFTLLERQTIGMLHSLIYNFDSRFYDEHVQNEASTLGIMTSGATIANITSMWIARSMALHPNHSVVSMTEKRIDSAEAAESNRGCVVIGSRLMHYSFAKAANLLGIGESNFRMVPVDGAGRVKIEVLREVVNECQSRRQKIIALVGVAGSTDCGSIDPLRRIAEVATEAKVHFHVDAAWGAPLIFSRAHRQKLAGIERADSISIDAHKQMCLPAGSSMLLLKNPRSAIGIRQRTSYMLHEESEDLGKYSLEGSRPANSLYIHAGLHMVGREGYAALVNENVSKAKVISSTIRTSTQFELLLEPETNIVLYRYIPLRFQSRRLQGELTDDDNVQINLANTIVQQNQYQAGRAYVSRTAINYVRAYPGVTIVALRMVIANPLIKQKDVTEVLNDQLRIAEELRM